MEMSAVGAIAAKQMSMATRLLADWRRRGRREAIGGLITDKSTYIGTRGK
jgi:hypothetical protein